MPYCARCGGPCSGNEHRREKVGEQRGGGLLGLDRHILYAQQPLCARCAHGTIGLGCMTSLAGGFALAVGVVSQDLLWTALAAGLVVVVCFIAEQG